MCPDPCPGEGPRARRYTAGPQDRCHARRNGCVGQFRRHSVHRVTTQIPDARRHLIRYYGAYSHRSRGARRVREEAEATGTAKPSVGAGADESPPQKSRASWARLLRRIYEVDPLLCPRCRGPLELLSVLVDPKVVDAILRHLDVTDQPTSVHARDPPAA
jgi:hypothetical protein